MTILVWIIALVWLLPAAVGLKVLIDSIVADFIESKDFPLLPLLGLIVLLFVPLLNIWICARVVSEFRTIQNEQKEFWNQ